MSPRIRHWRMAKSPPLPPPAPWRAATKLLRSVDDATLAGVLGNRRGQLVAPGGFEPVLEWRSRFGWRPRGVACCLAPKAPTRLKPQDVRNLVLHCSCRVDCPPQAGPAPHPIRRPSFVRRRRAGAAD